MDNIILHLTPSKAGKEVYGIKGSNNEITYAVYELSEEGDCANYIGDYNPDKVYSSKYIIVNRDATIYKSTSCYSTTKQLSILTYAKELQVALVEKAKKEEEANEAFEKLLQEFAEEDKERTEEIILKDEKKSFFSKIFKRSK